MAWNIYHGDCREVMPTLHPESVDSIVSDPPYGLSFMGKGWDHGVPGVEFWAEALRVAKPGAHLLAFGGTRTYHRLACAIEDAGWDIRDCVMWVYGSGFPKSHDVSKAIDKAAGAEREKVSASGGLHNNTNLNDDGWSKVGAENPTMDGPNPATAAARQWSGWGTALKPAWEPIIVARKPLCGTVAENVLTHGTGGINVDGCRVEGSKPDTTRGAGGRNGRYAPIAAQGRIVDNGLGRWPANVIHDGSDEVTGLFPQANGGNYPQGGKRSKSSDNALGVFKGNDQPSRAMGDSGSAARFFYCAKASKADRDADNKHPTVKPTALMRYLCRLVTPPGGVVLDPFTGSGSTGKAAIMEGFRFIGIEREAEYVEIAKARIGAAAAKSAQPSLPF